MLCPVRFGEDEGELAVRFEISEIKPKSVAGEITICVKSDGGLGRIAGVNRPNTAVVVEIQHKIQAIAPRQIQNGHDVTVALAPRDHI